MPANVEEELTVNILLQSNAVVDMEPDCANKMAMA